MHIPDGYLSPATCAALYAGSAPFWYVALKRVQRAFSSRVVPMLSLAAAFSFVIMMFNIPLPGGTTGHATGVAIAAVALGPWASILAISVALLIQAIFFGDGGITAFGANCFNMAIVGSITASLVYRTLAWRTPLESPRRIVAGAAAGYAAINLAAFCAAIEFGIQPGLFHDAAGSPLYAPYPLAIAIPAMMIGHLTFAGLAECVLTGSLIAYLQRHDISLLKPSTPTEQTIADSSIQAFPTWNALRPLWTGLAILLLATPVGLLAAGTAWGEWSAEDFKKPEMQREMAGASQGVVPPETTPAGLEKLASIWTSPMPDYAPRFLKSAQLGYILSAMFGTGLVIATCLGFGWVLGRPLTTRE